MTVVGIARIFARLLGEIVEGVAICVYDAAAHLRIPRELRRRPDVDSLLAGYRADER